jgi:hypothetical protein
VDRSSVEAWKLWDFEIWWNLSIPQLLSEGLRDFDVLFFFRSGYLFCLFFLNFGDLRLEATYLVDC